MRKHWTLFEIDSFLSFPTMNKTYCTNTVPLKKGEKAHTNSRKIEILNDSFIQLNRLEIVHFSSIFKKKHQTLRNDPKQNHQDLLASNQ